MDLLRASTNVHVYTYVMRVPHTLWSSTCHAGDPAELFIRSTSRRTSRARRLIQHTHNQDETRTYGAAGFFKGLARGDNSPDQPRDGDLPFRVTLIIYGGDFFLFFFLLQGL